MSDIQVLFLYLPFFLGGVSFLVVIVHLTLTVHIRVHLLYQRYFTVVIGIVFCYSCCCYSRCAWHFFIYRSLGTLNTPVYQTVVYYFKHFRRNLRIQNECQVVWKQKSIIWILYLLSRYLRIWCNNAVKLLTYYLICCWIPNILSHLKDRCNINNLSIFFFKDIIEKKSVWVCLVYNLSFWVRLLSHGGAGKCFKVSCLAHADPQGFTWFIFHRVDW